MAVTPDQVAEFRRDGYLVLENFLSDEEVESMKAECRNLVDAMDLSEHRGAVFRTGDKQIGDDYFISSGDKIRYFFEDGAVDESSGDKLKLLVDKHLSLNKIGHALHWLNPAFKKITFSDKVKNVIRALDFVDPVIVQSMYIFKNPGGIGGEVVPHQDGTYLYTEPLKLIGLWFPLEDATVENGCLWFAPGSHSRRISHRFMRNPDSHSDGPLLVYKEVGSPEDAVPEAEFVPVPARKGSCVLIHGSVVHKSERNSSDFARPAYTFHVVDVQKTKYSPDNWLQPTKSLPFPSLYSVIV